MTEFYQHTVDVHLPDPPGAIYLAPYSFDIDHEDLTLQIKFFSGMRSQVLSLMDSGEVEIHIVKKEKK